MEPREDVFGLEGAGVDLPKLGALCKVMSRITLVPKHPGAGADQSPQGRSSERPACEEGGLGWHLGT